MRSQLPHTAALLVAAALAVSAQTSSSKRGLVFVPDNDHPEDNKVWVESGSDLTWYYNYQSDPSAAYADQDQSTFEFVPMLWGAISDTSFLDSVVSQIKSGRNITHVLGFNEPDGPTEYGGSNLAPDTAAQIWVANMEPLARDHGVKLGLPACTGGTGGIPWLQEFIGNCSYIISSQGDGTGSQNCTYDFVNLHWYGDFGSLASHMGSYSAAFPNVTQWITEYNFDNQELSTTQDFYNMSADYFDRMDSVGRYSYFGSFRSDVSNVGPNAVMLNNAGELTDIGSWYLGGSATGVDPQSSSPGRLLGDGVVLSAAAVAAAAAVFASLL